MMMKRIIKLITLSYCLFLTGCVAAVAVGAAAGMAVYDKRSMSTIERDARIFYQVRKNIIQNPAFADARVNVTSFNRVVLLTGEVPSASIKVKAEKIARQTPDVYRVYNELTVDQPIPYSRIAKDNLINTEVRSKMLAKDGLQSGSIRIVTEDGVVYLMGIVTVEQANAAVDVARRVEGVDKVVKVFLYIR